MLGVCYHLYFVFYVYVVLMIYDSNCNTISCAYTAIWYVLYICMCMCACVCRCVYVCIYMYVYIYIYIYIYTYDLWLMGYYT